MARLAADPHLRDRVEAHLHRGHGRATALLKENQPLLDALAARLEKERVIEGDPFEELVPEADITTDEGSRADGFRALAAPTEVARTAAEGNSPSASQNVGSAGSKPTPSDNGTGYWKQIKQPLTLYAIFPVAGSNSQLSLHFPS